MIKQWAPSLLGLILGGLAGYLWYFQVGCASGTCPLTSQPLPAILYGAAVGFFLAPRPNLPSASR